MEEAISPHHIPSDDSAAAVVKGKRTKRQRLLLLAPPLSTSSPMLCGSLTEEEEDMANCLILLAKGRGADSTTQKIEPQAQIVYEAEAAVKFRSRRLADAATTTNGTAGFYVYECKTCNKCFPSFQALGGHRASHKKRKLESKEAVIDEDSIQLSINSFPTAAAAAATGGSNGKPRVHECSICGSEFSSGQALGGHMRRHRPASFPEMQEAKKERSGLPLDLNLPAPTDEDSRSCCELPKPPSASTATAFSFTSKAPLLFSSSALVDCLY